MKYKTVTIRYSEEELKKVETAAATDQRPKSQWIRVVSLKAAESVEKK